MGIDKFYRRGVFPAIALGDISDLYSYLLSVQGQVYFVEGNAGLDTNNGLSWETAFKTLTKALAVSHANIAASSKGWAARNTIFCKGDTFTENLVALAQKTDVIGVGSYNNKPRPGLIGTHAIAAATWMGCRFFNFEFLNDSADANWTFSQGGFEFHNCVFRCDAASTHALIMAIPHDVMIKNCQFLQDVDGDPFDTVAIAITGGAYNCQITNNIIYGDLGITIGAGSYYHCHLDNNFIQSPGKPVNDASSHWYLTNNIFISDLNSTTLSDVITAAVARAAGNIVTGTTGGTKNYPTCTD